ncbi:hypothetical protein BDV33DRAFT_26363 [Aspergillus novoparasiticus]|uniref:Uncharacterized protein n=1 Tax=Aspergillus novoparasiticus TaxID=986946 RepID=A0A5N6ED56_9EURO|nr:hypothetical protein BDV33DRAFT_26363 [Aspergillus novoparasiticus]
MTEPEDVEEDLFADLYDADETANQPTSTVEASITWEPTASVLPTQSAGLPATHVSEASHIETEDIRGVQQQLLQDGAHQHGTGNLDSGFANTITPMSGETEHHGTGIKEDGSWEGLYTCDCLVQWRK